MIMKKIFTRNFIIALFICIGIGLIYKAGFFAEKIGGDDRTNQNINGDLENQDKNNGDEEKNQLPIGMWTVDKSEDHRALGYSGQRKVASDRNGGFYLAYRKKNNGRHQIFLAHAKLEGGKYIFEYTDRPISFVSAGDDQRVPSIAVDEDGVLHVVWYGANSGNSSNERQIKYSRSADGGKTWSEWKNIAPVAGFRPVDEYWQEHPVITTGNGKIWVVWEGRDAKNAKQQIKMTVSYDDGASWSDWRNIKETPPNTQSRPVLLTRDGRELHLLAYSSWGNVANLQQIQHSYSTDGGETWSEWLNISDPEKDSRHLSACFTQSGRLYTVWRSFDPVAVKSRLEFTFLIGRSWKNPQSVVQSEQNQFFPSIACGQEEEQFFVAWMESIETFLLPREDPLTGAVFLSSFNGENFSSPIKINSGDDGHYPNLPEIFSNKSPLPIFFGEKETAELNRLQFRSIK